MSLTAQDARSLKGATMTSSDGAKIGKVADAYLDNDTQLPEWALVHTGLFGKKGTFVPLAQARLDGDSLVVPYSKDQIKDAPNAEPDAELSQEEEAALYAHYGLAYSDSTSDSGLPAGGAAGTATGADTTSTGVGTSSVTTSGTSTDDAMTLSQERMHVGTEQVQTRRAKLRKYVETEQVHETVPVTTEKAVVTHEPITDENRDRSLDGPEITERVHEEILTSERPVVTKETVPVERVRLDKQTVTENVETHGTVQSERVQVDDDTAGGSGR